MQNLGRASGNCHQYLGSTSACGNVSAWMGMPSQWVLERVPGTNRFWIRAEVMNDTRCAASPTALDSDLQPSKWLLGALLGQATGDVP